MILPYVLCAVSGAGSLHMESDLARYSPGQSIHLHVDGSTEAGSKVQLSLYHLGEKVEPDLVRLWSGDQTFEIRAPLGDGKGYLAVARIISDNGHESGSASCGIDVSSRWTEYPRYGYLAHFGPELTQDAPAVMAKLNRFHIDGIQFYDWQYRHHHPLPPGSFWHDIAKRETSAETVRSYIQAAHNHNMASMAYNLGFGGVDGYDEDGISSKWLLYYDKAGQSPYALNMPNGWETKKLFIFNPGDPKWQEAIYPREAAAVEAFKFDGWHMDQLGDLGKVFASDGDPVVVKNGFPSLLSGAKAHVPGTLIFNNVGGYGLDETLASPVDAVYLEAWTFLAQKTYADLEQTIEKMRSTGKAAILAAYMDYEKAKKFENRTPGAFNDPGILLADATTFASGAYHLELGDDGKMLDNEYFPNHNLEPSSSLLEKLAHYYDFAVANEELLAAKDVKPISNPTTVQSKEIWSFARTDRKRTMVHLIHIASPAKDDWRDPDGIYQDPGEIENVRVSIGSGWHKAYAVSPDWDVALPEPLKIQSGAVVVPKLHYWTMLVLQ